MSKEEISNKSCRLNDEFIEKSNKIHNNKYDYSLIEYKNAKTKVKIICPEHGGFELTPDAHLYSFRGCQMCSNRKVNTSMFIKKAKDIHGDKFDYSIVDYKNNYTKIKIICKEHGIFEILPNNHLNRKQGCGKCVGLHKTTEDFIKNAIEVHGYKYDYSLVEYNKSYNKIKIICMKHNKIFEQTPSDHLSGNGCPYCKTSSTEEFIEKSNKIHNFKYDYSLTVYKNCKTKIKIICKKHNKIFLQTPSNHLTGTGCPLCNESKGENKIALFLEKNNIKFDRQHKFDNCKYKFRLPFDFYLPIYNTCVEYDGKQHFESVEYWGGLKSFEEIQMKDKIKNEYCKKNNINLIRIRYDENILDILNKVI